MRAVIDTNILIDVLNAVPEALEELDRYDAVGISVVTWIEVLVGCRTDDEVQAARLVLSQLDVVRVPEAIAAGQFGCVKIAISNCRTRSCWLRQWSGGANS